MTRLAAPPLLTFSFVWYADCSFTTRDCGQACVEQNFEVAVTEGGAPLRVSGNSVFLAELGSQIATLAERCAAVCGTLSETVERRRLVGVFGMYVMLRHLTPNNVVRVSC